MDFLSLYKLKENLLYNLLKDITMQYIKTFMVDSGRKENLITSFDKVCP